MPELRRTGPYIWATWLPKLLAGSDSCEWAIWFKAQYYGNSYKKRPRDLSEYLLKHTSMVQEVREQLEADDYGGLIEDQNRFDLNGSSIQVTIQGKPDLVAVKDGAVTVIDIKSGQARDFHAYQVMLYMYALGRSKYQDMPMEGKLVYQTHEVEVPYSRIDDEFTTALGALVRRLCSLEPPARVPSPRECGWCEITVEDCPDLMEGEFIQAEADAF